MLLLLSMIILFCFWGWRLDDVLLMFVGLGLGVAEADVGRGGGGGRSCGGVVSTSVSIPRFADHISKCIFESVWLLLSMPKNRENVKK